MLAKFFGPRFLVRSATGAGLVFACVLTAQPADVVIMKDGFIIQGNVRKEMESARDPVAKSVSILKADGFDYIDDGVRMIIFSTHNRQGGQVNKDVKLRPDYKAYSNPFGLRRSTHPLPQMNGIREMPDFNDKWRRTIKVNVPFNDWDKIDQQITYLDPYCCFIVSPTHVWTQSFRTAEMSPKEVRKLLSTHPELIEADGKVDPIKRLAIARFLKDVGWLHAAKEDMDKLKKAAPNMSKEAQESFDKLQKELDAGAAELVVNEADLALAAGRYNYTAEMLALFPEKSADPKEVDRATRLMAKSKTAKEQFEAGRRLLRTLIDEVTGLGAAKPYLAVGGGPLAAVWPMKGGNPQLQVLAAAAEEVYENLHPDSAGRIEFFVNLATQVERERAKGQPASKKHEELLATAISGWARGKNGATPNYDQALAIWSARSMVLDYQRGGNLNERNTILGNYKKQPNPLPLDELTQIISLLPPAEPENLLNRTGTLVKPGNGVPEGVYKRRSAPYGSHGAGLDYFIKLPPEYHHGRAYPVIVALTYPNLDAEKFIGGIAHEADRHGYIVIAPDWAPVFGPSVSGWSWDGADHDFVMAALRDTIRHFTVDNDRVFLLGGGAGADMAMDVGASHPDLFAGVVAVGPHPLWSGFFENYWQNCQKLPFYVVTGDLSGEANGALRKLYGPWMRNGFPSLHVIYRGRGLEWYGIEIPTYFDWMNRKKRVNPTAVMNLGANRYRWHIIREEDNHFYWLGADKVHPGNLSPNGRPKTNMTPANLIGDIKAGNKITLNSVGVRTISVWLGRDMIDWSRPVQVYVNNNIPSGWKIGGKIVEQDINVLLEDYWQRGDRRTLFLARLEFANPN
jgi:pimeloyl-ACP methyl ester carboxylesterase